jgi:hypothetical protein
MKTILLFLLVSLDAPAPLSARPEQTHDLAKLSPEHLRRMDGHRGTFRCSLDSMPWERRGYTVFDCAGGNDTSERTVWVAPGQEEIGDEVWEIVVVATLEVVEHPLVIAPDGTRFEPWTEYRLADAVVVARK